MGRRLPTTQPLDLLAGCWAVDRERPKGTFAGPAVVVGHRSFRSPGAYQKGSTLENTASQRRAARWSEKKYMDLQNSLHEPSE